MSKHYLFIEYRELMFDADYTHLKVDFLGVVGKELNTLILQQLPADDGNARPEILAYETLKSLEGIVPVYCPPMTAFAAFAHNLNHEVHHPRDYAEARELTEFFKCSEDDIIIVECILGRHGEMVAVNEQRFADYFADLQV